MTDPGERLRAVRAMFDELIDTPLADRNAVLERLAGTDASLRQEVMELIADADATADLHSPFAGLLAGPSATDTAGAMVGQRIGAYDVVGLVGMGGMGAVYEAVRADDQYRKRVAIKLVKRGINSELTLARFRRERQILASLEHPHIARLLDGGVTSDGQPFLVMEFVDGEPITRWCDARSASVRERLAIVRQVCSAVQYAHKNLVVHRDIKPGNIVVTPEGSAKLLDFGIAKLLGEDTSSGDLPLTRGGARTFTPEYASPEQIRGDALTTASDIYSLGVVMFELLTGRRPHLSSGRSLVEIERAVLEEPVSRPSSAVTTQSAAQLGERTSDRLRKRLRGELDNIVLTALRSEPDGRYGTAAELDDDIGRYLDGMPVRAHGQWAGYRLRKFVRRNVAAVVASALVLIAVAAGGIATATQSRRVVREQLKQEQVNTFLRGLLLSVQPEVGNRDARMSEVLDSAARRLERDLAGQPEVRAELESVIGQSYQGLGRLDEAEQHYRTALALRTRAEGPTSTSAIVGLSNLGQVFMAKGVFDSADIIFRDALALHKQSGRTPDTLYASLLSNMGSLRHNQGKPDEAEKYHREALTVRRRLKGDRDDLVAQGINDVGVAVGEQGRIAEAESLTRVAVGILRTNHPEPNVRVAGALNALAGALDFEGKNAAADSAYRETLALRKLLLGPQHPDYALTLFNYSSFSFSLGRYEEAARMAREILALRGKSLPESHIAIAAALQTLGRSLDKTGDTAGGERALTESLELRRKYLGPTNWLTASSEGWLAEHYTALKQYAKAESLLVHAQQLFVAAIGESNPRTQVNTRRLVTLYTAWNKPAQAAEYQAKLPPSR